MRTPYKLLFTLIAISISITGFAANKTTNGSSSNWSVASAWTPSGVPDDKDNVTITVANFVVNTIAECKDLTLNATLVLNADLKVEGVLYLNGQSITTNTSDLNVKEYCPTLNGTITSTGGEIIFDKGFASTSIIFDVSNTYMEFDENQATFGTGSLTAVDSEIKFKKESSSTGDFSFNISNESTLFFEKEFNFGPNSGITADNSDVIFKKGGNLTTGSISLSNNSSFEANDDFDIQFGSLVLNNSDAEFEEYLTINGNISVTNGSSLKMNESLNLMGGEIFVENSSAEFDKDVALQNNSKIIVGNQADIVFEKDLTMYNTSEVLFNGINGTNTGEFKVKDDLELNGSSLIHITDNIALTGTLTIGDDILINSSGGLILYNNNGSNIGKVHLNMNGENQKLENNNSNATVNLFSWTIEDGAQISGSNVNAFNKVEILDGELKTNNKLILASDQITQGYIKSNGSTVDGDLTISKKYYGTTGWRQISSPIAGLTLGDLNATMTTSGFAGSDFPNTGYNVYYYDETQNGGLGVGFVPITSLNYVFDNTRGYYIYMHPDNGTWPLELQYDGNFNAGDINLTVTYTDHPAFDDNVDGWNFVANPYPAPIDWDSPNWVKQNISNAIYIWDKDMNGGIGGFRTYINGVGTQGGSNVIALGQGFWVKAVGNNPVLTVKESCKADLDNGFVRPGDLPITLKMRLTDNSTTYVDEAVLRFDATGKETFEQNEDAVKYFNSAAVPNIYFKNGDYFIAINTVNTFGQGSLPLTYNVPGNGTFTFDFERSNFGDINCIVLEDKETQTFINLKTDSTYTFTHSSASNVNDRFVIHFTNGVTTKTTNVTCSNTFNGKIEAFGYGAGPWNYIWKDQNGDIIEEDLQNSHGSTLFDLRPGTYTIEVQDQNALCDVYSQTVDVLDGIKVTPDFEYVLTENPSGVASIEFSNLSENATDYNWNLGNGFFSDEENPIGNYVSEGVVTISLTAINNDCFNSISKTVEIINQNGGTTSVSDVSKDDYKITVYNKTENWEFDVADLKVTKIELIALNGTVVETIQNPSNQVITISKNGLSTGVYMAHVETVTSQIISIKVFK